VKYKECTLGALFCVHILNYTHKHWFNSSNNALDLLAHDCITKHDTILVDYCLIAVIYLIVILVINIFFRLSMISVGLYYITIVQTCSEFDIH